MAHDLTASEDNKKQQIVQPPAWTKIVTKAGDIVRNQKANMKTNAAVQTSPSQKEKFDTFLGYLDTTMTNNNGDNSGLNKEISAHDLINLGLASDYGIDEGVVPVSEVPAQVLLARKIEETLREAKKSCLQCEVLVPCELTSRIANDIARMSEYEPCGLRGCVVIFNLEENAKSNACRKIGKMKFDPETVATFELHLTLRRDTGSWLSLRQLVPARFLKKLGKTPALIVSEHYTLSKKKLYRSSSETSY